MNQTQRPSLAAKRLWILVPYLQMNSQIYFLLGISTQHHRRSKGDYQQNPLSSVQQNARTSITKMEGTTFSHLETTRFHPEERKLQLPLWCSVNLGFFLQTGKILKSWGFWIAVRKTDTLSNWKEQTPLLTPSPASMTTTKSIIFVVACRNKMWGSLTWLKCCCSACRQQ